MVTYLLGIEIAKKGAMQMDKVSNDLWGLGHLMAELCYQVRVFC